MAKDNIAKIHKIIIKEKLERKDFLEILYLMSGEESKLLNYSEGERFILLKFFTWIRDLVNIAELIFDYQQFLLEREEQAKLQKIPPKRILSDRAKKSLETILHRIEHDVKFLIDVYSQISRTSLSIGATGMLEILKNKYEVKYENAQTDNNVVEKRR